MSILVCSNCSAQLAKDDKFCGECGTPRSSAKSEPQKKEPEYAKSVAGAGSQGPVSPTNRNIAVFCLLVLFIGIVLSLNSGQNNVQRDNVETTQQSHSVRSEPESNGITKMPETFVVKSDPALRLCTQSGECQLAQGIMQTGEVITSSFANPSDFISAELIIRFGDLEEFYLDFVTRSSAGQLIRIPPPNSNDEDVVAFELFDGAFAVAPNRKMVVVNLGGGTCYLANGSFSVSAVEKFASIEVKQAEGKCEDPNGKLHFFSAGGSKNFSWQIE